MDLYVVAETFKTCLKTRFIKCFMLKNALHMTNNSIRMPILILGTTANKKSQMISNRSDGNKTENFLSFSVCFYHPSLIHLLSSVFHGIKGSDLMCQAFHIVAEPRCTISCTGTQT